VDLRRRGLPESPDLAGDDCVVTLSASIFPRGGELVGVSIGRGSGGGPARGGQERVQIGNICAPIWITMHLNNYIGGRDGGSEGSIFQVKGEINMSSSGGGR
jgi:hypothetical protein